MACYSPLIGYRSRVINESGKRSLVFNKKKAVDDMEVKIPCGQCIGCRIEYSRQWALRCVAEAQMHEQNSYITLTYNNENLPKGGTLVKDKRDENGKLIQSGHFQLFMKRLRKHYKNKKIRYFHCGEYGDKLGRPHYHAILFGIQFEDLKEYKYYNGNMLYTSDILSKIWGKGFVTVGDVTFESAAYVARYVLKKINGKDKVLHYSEVDKETGLMDVENMKEPEYTTMSRRDGIGKTWFDKYSSDVYPKDFVTFDGKKIKPPKYFDTLYERIKPFDMDEIKQRRHDYAIENQDENTEVRLRARKKVQELKNRRLKRQLDEESQC